MIYQWYYFFLHIHLQNSVIITKPNEIIIIKRNSSTKYCHKDKTKRNNNHKTYGHVFFLQSRIQNKDLRQCTHFFSSSSTLLRNLQGWVNRSHSHTFPCINLLHVWIMFKSYVTGANLSSKTTTEDVNMLFCHCFICLNNLDLSHFNLIALNSRRVSNCLIA